MNVNNLSFAGAIKKIKQELHGMKVFEIVTADILGTTDSDIHSSKKNGDGLL